MNLTINNVRRTVQIYSTKQTILELIAYEEATTPRFFSLTGTIAQDAIITVKDVRGILDKFELKDFTNESIKEILNEFKELTRIDLGMIWISLKYDVTERSMLIKVFESQNVPKFFSVIDLTRLSRAENIVSEYRDFLKALTSQIKTNITTIEYRRKIDEQFDPVPIVGMHNFEVETEIARVEIETQEALVNIFDAMDVSVNIPFVMLKTDRVVYKVYTKSKPQQEWIDLEPEDQGIYFYATLDGNVYVLCEWKEKYIDISLVGKIKEEYKQLSKVVLSSVKDRILYREVSTSIAGVKGFFKVDSFPFNKVVFADLIMNNELMKYFTVLNEGGNTVTTRPGFSFYYKVNNNYVIKDGTILSITDIDNNLLIRQSRFVEVERLPVMRVVIGKLLGIYLNNYERVAKEYSKIIPQFSIAKKARVKKEDTKTGTALKALQRKRPKLFGGKTQFSKKCQPKERHPILTEERPDVKPSRVLNYPTGSTDWYTCSGIPSKKGEVWPYPGLNHLNQPCCFVNNQYKDRESYLNAYLGEREGIITQKFKESNDLGRILIYTKPVYLGEYGHVPHYLKFLIENSGYGYKRYHGDQKFLPILRTGVIPSHASFFHCLLRATKKSYFKTDVDEREAYVNDIRKNISSVVDGVEYNVSKQETYGIDVRSVLLDYGLYIDPRIFVTIAEVYFNVNIFILKQNDNNINGNMTVPHFSVAFVPKEFDTKKKCVFILLHQSTIVGYPYQCEILVKVDLKESGFDRISYTFDSNDKFVKVIKEAMSLYNKLFFSM